MVRWKRDAEGQIVGVEEYTIRVPGMLSILVSGDFTQPMKASETEVKGLADLPADEFLRRRHPGASDAELAKIRPRYWPNVPVVFQTYHLMIAIGVTLTALALLGCLLWARGKLYEPRSRLLRGYFWLLVLTPLMAEIACQAGWFTAEMGRQPWVVYEVLKTSDGTSAVVKAPQVLRSIILFFLVYLLLTVLFLTVLFRLIRKGPTTAVEISGLPETWEPLALKAERQTEG